MFILYSTLGCHLCDNALAIVRKYLRADEIRIVDIAEDEALMDAYGIRIPVMKNAITGAEIGWPFDDATFERWLAKEGW